MAKDDVLCKMLRVDRQGGTRIRQGDLVQVPACDVARLEANGVVKRVEPQMVNTAMPPAQPGAKPVRLGQLLRKLPDEE